MADAFSGRVRHPRPRNERGATAVLMAMTLVVVVGAAGLGIDVANTTLARGDAQRGVDSAALAIATDCVLGHSDCSPAANHDTAEYFVGQNAPGAEVGMPVVPATGGQVTVSADESVPTSLMAVLGIDSADVSATATATWGGHPVAGAPPLPLAVPYCQWLENQPGTSSSPTLLRTDLVGKVLDTTNTLPLLNRVLATLLPLLFNVTASCESPDGQDIAQMRGPVWLTGITEVLSGIAPGLLTFNSTNCETYVDDLNVAIGGVLSTAIPPSCIAKLGTTIKAGDIIMLPVYVPANNLLNLGIQASVCTILFLTTSCVTVPPKLGVKVIGYAPFKVTGWNFTGNIHVDPSAPACSPLLTLALPLLAPLAIGCQGLTGHFVDVVVNDSNYTYSPDGADFGATEVRLVQ